MVPADGKPAPDDQVRRHTKMQGVNVPKDADHSINPNKNAVPYLKEAFLINAGLFEVQKINPPPQSLGIHSLPVDTHNGDQITVENEVMDPSIRNAFAFHILFLITGNALS